MANASKKRKIIEEYNYNSYFPSVLRKLMRDYSVTQDELANHLGISRQAVSQYMNGNTRPDICSFKKIVDYFNEYKNINYSLDNWLGTQNISYNDSQHGIVSLNSLNLSPETFSNLLAYGNKSEINTINLILENNELIEFLHDYLGQEIRNNEHFPFQGARDTLLKHWKFADIFEYNKTPDDIYNEIKLDKILKILKKIRENQPNKFK